MFDGKCGVSYLLIYVLRVAYILGMLLTLSPSTYVGHPTFCISEWLAAFSIVISFYILVAFEKGVETVTQNWCKVQWH
jgi:hypothetical protein